MNKNNNINRYLRKLYFSTLSPVAFTSFNKIWRYISADPKRPKGLDTQTLKHWLDKQDAYTVFKQPPSKVRTEKIIVEYPDQMWDCDIMVMEDGKLNNGFKYVLCVIDLFSRYLWVRATKTKTAVECGKAFKSVCAEGRVCEILRTDNGGEFTGKPFQEVLREKNVIHQIAYGAHKANYVERVQRTIQERLYKYFYENNTKKFIDVLQPICTAYNNTVHGSTGMPPMAINKNNYTALYNRLYESELNKRARQRPVFAFDIGDLVRISLTKEPFAKGYEQKYTEELFRIVNRIPSQPPRYKLEDLKGERIKGSFYTGDLQKFHKRDISKLSFKIEKVIKKRKDKGREFSLVKWLGYGDKFNSWVPTTQLKKL
jgi:hypothetical protein